MVFHDKSGCFHPVLGQLSNQMLGAISGAKCQTWVILLTHHGHVKDAAEKLQANVETLTDIQL